MLAVYNVQCLFENLQNAMYKFELAREFQSKFWCNKINNQWKPRSLCGRCSEPVCWWGPPVSGSWWSGDQGRRSTNNHRRTLKFPTWRRPPRGTKRGESRGPADGPPWADASSRAGSSRHTPCWWRLWPDLCFPSAQYGQFDALQKGECELWLASTY